MPSEIPTQVDSHEESTNETAQMDDSQTEETNINLSVTDGADPTLMTEYQFIVDLLSRQDEVLQGLDELNERVLATIEEISAQRQAEIEAENADLEVSTVKASQPVDESGLKRAA